MSRQLATAPDHPLVATYERGAERLRDAVLASCEPAAEFPQRLHAALAAALEFCAAEPELGRLLTTRPFGEDHELLLPPYKRWQAYYASLLRDAAATSPDAFRQPSFFEPVMISGVYFCISRRLRDEEAETGLQGQMASLLPSLQDSVLSCYRRG